MLLILDVYHREARMEDAIARARARLEHEDRLSWSRRLEQGALAVRIPGALQAWQPLETLSSSQFC